MVFLLTLVAALIAFPAEVILRPAALLFAAVLAALPALFPRTRLVGLAILLCVFGWLLGTYVYDQVITIPRLIALATRPVPPALPGRPRRRPALRRDRLSRRASSAGCCARSRIVSASAIVSVLLLAVVKAVLGPVFLLASLSASWRPRPGLAHHPQSPSTSLGRSGVDRSPGLTSPLRDWSMPEYGWLFDTRRLAGSRGRVYRRSIPPGSLC